MVFDRILGQEPAVRTLTRALETGRLHHAYRFEGPDGVGKELAAFAVAQSLVCTRGGALGCGTCAACQRAVRLSPEEPRVPQHPDVVLVQRGLYPASLLGATSKEATGIGVEQIRRIVLARAGFPPHEARALVFVIRDAHELTLPAANALLKTLEEPGPQVRFILLTSQPNRLIDTIRSRTFAIRFAPLADAHVASILGARGMPAALAAYAQGSASAALDLAEDDARAAREAFVSGVLAAVAAPTLAGAVELAGDRTTDRDSLKAQIFHLAQHLAVESAKAAAAGDPTSARGARRYRAALEAIDHLEKNAQPALVLESMVSRMREA